MKNQTFKLCKATIEKLQKSPRFFKLTWVFTLLILLLVKFLLSLALSASPLFNLFFYDNFLFGLIIVCSWCLFSIGLVMGYFVY